MTAAKFTPWYQSPIIVAWLGFCIFSSGLALPLPESELKSPANHQIERRQPALAVATVDPDTTAITWPISYPQASNFTPASQHINDAAFNQWVADGNLNVPFFGSAWEEVNDMYAEDMSRVYATAWFGIYPLCGSDAWNKIGEAMPDLTNLLGHDIVDGLASHQSLEEILKTKVDLKTTPTVESVLEKTTGLGLSQVTLDSILGSSKTDILRQLSGVDLQQLQDILQRASAIDLKDLESMQKQLGQISAFDIQGLIGKLPDANLHELGAKITSLIPDLDINLEQLDKKLESVDLDAFNLKDLIGRVTAVSFDNIEKIMSTIEAILHGYGPMVRLSDREFVRNATDDTLNTSDSTLRVKGAGRPIHAKYSSHRIELANGVCLSSDLHLSVDCDWEVASFNGAQNEYFHSHNESSGQEIRNYIAVNSEGELLSANQTQDAFKFGLLELFPVEGNYSILEALHPTLEYALMTRGDGEPHFNITKLKADAASDLPAMMKAASDLAIDVSELMAAMKDRQKAGAMVEHLFHNMTTDMLHQAVADLPSAVRADVSTLIEKYANVIPEDFDFERLALAIHTLISTPWMDCVFGDFYEMIDSLPSEYVPAEYRDYLEIAEGNIPENVAVVDMIKLLKRLGHKYHFTAELTIKQISQLLGDVPSFLSRKIPDIVIAILDKLPSDETIADLDHVLDIVKSINWSDPSIGDTQNLIARLPAELLNAMLGGDSARLLKKLLKIIPSDMHLVELMSTAKRVQSLDLAHLKVHGLKRIVAEYKDLIESLDIKDSNLNILKSLPDEVEIQDLLDTLQKVKHTNFENLRIRDMTKFLDQNRAPVEAVASAFTTENINVRGAIRVLKKLPGELKVDALLDEIRQMASIDVDSLCINDVNAFVTRNKKLIEAMLSDPKFHVKDILALLSKLPGDLLVHDLLNMGNRIAAIDLETLTMADALKYINLIPSGLQSIIFFDLSTAILELQKLPQQMVVKDALHKIQGVNLQTTTIGDLNQILSSGLADGLLVSKNLDPKQVDGVVDWIAQNINPSLKLSDILRVLQSVVPLLDQPVIDIDASTLWKIVDQVKALLPPKIQKVVDLIEHIVPSGTIDSAIQDLDALIKKVRNGSISDLKAFLTKNGGKDVAELVDMIVPSSTQSVGDAAKLLYTGNLGDVTLFTLLDHDIPNDSKVRGMLRGVGDRSVNDVICTADKLRQAKDNGADLAQLGDLFPVLGDINQQCNSTVTSVIHGIINQKVQLNEYNLNTMLGVTPLGATAPGNLTGYFCASNNDPKTHGMMQALRNVFSNAPEWPMRRYDEIFAKIGYENVFERGYADVEKLLDDVTNSHYGHILADWSVDSIRSFINSASPTKLYDEVVPTPQFNVTIGLDAADKSNATTMISGNSTQSTELSVREKQVAQLSDAKKAHKQQLAEEIAREKHLAQLSDVKKAHKKQLAEEEAAEAEEKRLSQLSEAKRKHKQELAEEKEQKEAEQQAEAKRQAQLSETKRKHKQELAQEKKERKEKKEKEHEAQEKKKSKKEEEKAAQEKKKAKKAEGKAANAKPSLKPSPTPSPSPIAHSMKSKGGK